jgi:outer membrane protein OmpA-like peptidoglycan-associated protein
LRLKRSIATEVGNKVPGYIVTFSDMVTLLLTFFVMLLSLAQTQDPELVDKGRDSFVRSIRTYGLGMLIGRKGGPHFGEVKPKYSISPPDGQLETRVINAQEQQTQQVFEQLRELMKAMPSQIVAQKTIFSVIDIQFSPGDATLNESAKEALTKFCLDLQLEREAKANKLYVLGLANDAATEKEQWLLSARRARSAGVFLQGLLPSSGNWRVYYWGAGTGGDWIGQESPVSKGSQVQLAVLRGTN